MTNNELGCQVKYFNNWHRDMHDTLGIAKGQRGKYTIIFGDATKSMNLNIPKGSIMYAANAIELFMEYLRDNPEQVQHFIK